METKAISGVPGWCVVLTVGGDLYAMVNVRGEFPTVFSSFPATFTKHCGFVGAEKLAESDVRTAQERLSALDFTNPTRLLESGAIRFTGVRNPENAIKQLEELA